MNVLLWSGAVLLAVCSVACGINLGSRVAKGAEKAWSPQILGWAIGFHGAAGFAALMLIAQTRG